MKKLNITKEQFNRSNYFQRKYGKLEYVSESGKLFKTTKGEVLKFVNESKRVVKESASELSEFAEELGGLFGKKVLVRVNSTGTECTVDTSPEVDKEVQHFIQSACGANGWECKRIARNLILTYRIKSVKEFNEGFMSNMGKDGRHLYSIVFNSWGWEGSVQEYGKTEEDAIQNAIAKGKIDEDEEIVEVIDLGERRPLEGDENPFRESRKLVKEGAGAGYTVTIKGLKFGKILDKKLVDVEGDPFGCYECKVEILPGEYEIGAEDYYNDFFWQEHEWGDTPKAKIDGGVATVVYSKQWRDDEQAEQDLREQVENQELDISFDYGGGWIHVALPREKIAVDHVDVGNSGYYAGILDIELNAPDLADAVNSGYASLDDRNNEEDDEEI